MIDCTDEQLIEEVRRRGFVIRDAQIGRKWVGLSEEEVALIWHDMGARPKINGYDFAKVIEEKLKERNAMNNAGMLMNNEEWQEKYTKMSIFYQDRLKYTENMLAKAMEMNMNLVGMLQDNRAEDKFGGPGIGDSKFKDPSIWNGCAVRGLKGVNGYVCPNTACPGRITCNTSTAI